MIRNDHNNNQFDGEHGYVRSSWDESHGEQGFMTAPTTDVELLSKLNPGAHVRFHYEGRSYTGMVLGSPIPNDSSGDTCVRVRCDQRQETIMVPWTDVIETEVRDDG